MCHPPTSATKVVKTTKTIGQDEKARLAIDAALSALASHEEAQSNCLFQLALMLARIAVEPGPEAYKEEASRALLGLIRAKPKTNVVPLFGRRAEARTATSGLSATA